MTDVKIIRTSGLRSFDIIEGVEKLGKGLGLKIETKYLNLEFALFDNTAVFLVNIDGPEETIARFNKMLPNLPKIKQIDQV